MVSFKNNKGELLQGVVHEPKKYTTAIVFLHGFPGGMEGTAKRVCTAMAKKGFLCLRFAFSGVPPSEGKFSDKLMSQEVKEVKYAINFLEKNYSYKKLVLVGHSTGAIDAALYAHKDRRVSKLVLLGMINELDTGVNYDFTARQVKSFWENKHITYSRPGEWVHKKKLRKAFYDEFFSLSVKRSLKKYRKPVFIIHGSKDSAIPYTDAKELAKEIKAKFILIQGAGHNFKPKTKELIARLSSVSR
ncbi:MAG: alpha/beta hydrolase [Candidatus Woesearchaeota archaeon]|jgi:hypothetical protein|nr:alpha/beta hydrolase [Candidatus Woesearchaeota archaeon]MDP7182165.1 alpha/beta hydrolase [Candidatus Woesearchaeota archaeon]MDP7199301.1 alpha/beta hydrolase [Candidatus Woesearchaeota archaeon]MDP7467963.1 alpha/beta hydrolase [Candidatus Woesearchaeota archaeon]MDP7647588.1 alpha/beta hydrolase [Candidatus Woesearchaeota archaeon]|tara:strand:- start:320 stop:1054 length:735 start_codon:yes stop_codon:yes gene_type:complete